MNVLLTLFINIFSTNMPLLYRAFASHAEGWVLESLSWQTQIIETGDSVHDQQQMWLVPLRVLGDNFKRWCHIRCDMLQNPHDLMTMNDGHRSKFAALHQQTSRHVKPIRLMFLVTVYLVSMQSSKCRTHKIIKCSLYDYPVCME